MNLYSPSRKRSDSTAGLVDVDMEKDKESENDKREREGQESDGGSIGSFKSVRSGRSAGSGRAIKSVSESRLGSEKGAGSEGEEEEERGSGGVDVIDNTSSTSGPGGPASLDNLFSPTEPKRSLVSKLKGERGDDGEGMKRESIVDSGVGIEVEVEEDDEARFSNVPLSGGTVLSREDRESVGAGTREVWGGAGLKEGAEKRGSGRTSLLDKRSTVSLGRPGSSTLESLRSSRHKKSASSYTLGSLTAIMNGGGPNGDKLAMGEGEGKVGNLPFILQRLDLQKLDGGKADRRTSGEGQLKLKEEFSKLQEEIQAKEAESIKAIDWEFWGNVMADYRQFATDNPEKLAKAIERGIPKTLRGMMWQLMAASKETELEATYLRLLKESSPHEKAITRDLGRTFPHHDYFNEGHGIGQENLFNVLKAYSLYDPEVGYCQGLPFVVAILLLNMPDEEAFCFLVRLMHSYGLRGHFLPEMPGLQLRMYQFDRLVEELLPVLHVHFLRQGVKSSMFCSQWFLTMFSYRFPLDIVFRIYDNVIASGVEAIFGFSIVLLQRNEEALLKLKFDDILAFLKNKLFERYKCFQDSESIDDAQRSTGNLNDGGSTAYLVDEFVQDALSLKITPFMLDSYAHEYDELVRTREAHLVEMDTLRNTNRQLAAQVKDLEDTLGALNTEHCDIVKELVMTRIKNEELESELVRYKLLYAEAMHQNEDAMSSHRLSTFSSPK